MDADVAQSAVHLHGKEEVAGSSPAVSTIKVNRLVFCKRLIFFDFMDYFA